MAEQAGQHRALAVARHQDHALVDRIDRLCRRRHADLLRRTQEFGRELADRIRHGRRKQHGLPLCRKLHQDLSDRRHEAEIEHLVGLVQHHDLRFVEAQRVGADMVEQAARRGDDDVDAARELPDLRARTDAADDDGNRRVEVLAIDLDRIGDLLRQFARRREDQVAAGARFDRRAVCRQALQHRQHEGRRLAGAGLGDAEQVMAGEDRRYCLHLDRRGGRIAFGGHRAKDGLGEAEIGKLRDRHARIGARNGGRSPGVGRRRNLVHE
jgi:hypothetical protein